jgi:hypothetical protein
MYTCPYCGMVSHNPNDEANRYCGACHQFAERDELLDLLRGSGYEADNFKPGETLEQFIARRHQEGQ